MTQLLVKFSTSSTKQGQTMTKDQMQLIILFLSELQELLFQNRNVSVSLYVAVLDKIYKIKDILTEIAITESI